MMLEVEKIMKAILTINSDAKVYVKMNTENTLATAEIEWLDSTTPISKEDINKSSAMIKSRNLSYGYIEQLPCQCIFGIRI